MMALLHPYLQIEQEMATCGSRSQVVLKTQGQKCLISALGRYCHGALLHYGLLAKYLCALE